LNVAFWPIAEDEDGFLDARAPPAWTAVLV